MDLSTTLTIIASIIGGAISPLVLYIKERAKNKNISNLRSQRYPEDDEWYEEEEIYAYLKESTKIDAIWLSGAALYYCIKDLVSNFEEIFENQTSSDIRLVFIITDKGTKSAKDAAIDRLPKNKLKKYDDNLKTVDSRLTEALINIGELINEFEHIKVKVHTEIHFCRKPIEERIWIINPNQEDSYSFIKIYPYRNKDCRGIYKGGDKFKLRNNPNSKRFNFYKNKFWGYTEVSDKEIHEDNSTPNIR